MLHINKILIIFSFLLFYFVGVLNSKNIDKELYENAERYAKDGNYKDASHLFRQLSATKDSLYYTLNKKQVKRLRDKYSIQEIELETNKKINSFLKLVLIIVLSFLLALVILVFLLHKQGKLLIKSENELQKSKILTEASIKNKSVFLSNMSHEIKTPLNAISGFSELIINPDLDDPTRQQCCDIIKLNSDLLIKVLNDVVDISCLDVNNIKMSISECNVIELCKNVIKTIEKIKQTPADIVFETDLQSLVLKTDIMRLQQVLINLLINATKFTKRGVISLRVTKNSTGFAEFMVTDTGSGIPLDKQKNIFSRFTRVNEKVQGTGLGLYICQLIIKRLGGNIWIDSKYTSGTRFVFTHPINNNGDIKS